VVIKLKYQNAKLILTGRFVFIKPVLTLLVPVQCEDIKLNILSTKVFEPGALG
jgi:hypothetical protein